MKGMEEQAVEFTTIINSHITCQQERVVGPHIGGRSKPFESVMVDRKAKRLKRQGCRALSPSEAKQGKKTAATVKSAEKTFKLTLP